MPAPAAPPPHGARALLLLLTALAAALACHHLPPRDDAFLWDSVRLLQDMAPTPAQPCHHQHDTLRFPDALLQTHRPQQAAATALRVLQHLFAVLGGPDGPRQWDDHARHRLLNNLQHRIQRLQQCLTANGTLAQGQGPATPSSASTSTSRTSATSSAPTATAPAPGSTSDSKLAPASNASTTSPAPPAIRTTAPAHTRPPTRTHHHAATAAPQTPLSSRLPSPRPRDAAGAAPRPPPPLTDPLFIPRTLFIPTRVHSYLFTYLLDGK